MKKKINALHERTLKITCGDKSSSFNELLEKDNSVTVHENEQALLTGICKASSNMSLSPTILNATPCNLRNPVSFKMRKVYSG